MTEQNNLPAAREAAVQLAQPLADMDRAWRAAGFLARSRLLPKALYANNPEQTQANVMLVLWYGAELNLPPMQALQSIYVVNGRPQLSGQLWLSKVREAGHKAFVACRNCDRPPEAHPVTKPVPDGEHLYVKDHDETRCRLTIIRGDTGDRHSELFTAEDAQRAGLLNKDIWKAWRKRMLLWRSASNCATIICPEVALGYGMEGDEAAAEQDPAESLAQAVDARTEPPPEPADIHDAEVVPDPDEQAAQEAADEKRRQEILDIEAEYSEAGEPLIDPDCAAGKCGACSGPPCQHECHTGGGS